MIVGNIVGFLNNGFHFGGRIGGLKVSNVALYSAGFSPPQTLTRRSPHSTTGDTSNTVLLLGPNFTEIVGNVTLFRLTTSGSIENYIEKVDIPIDRSVGLSDLAFTIPKNSDIYGLYTATSIISDTSWGCAFGLGPNITINSSAWYNNNTSLITLAKSTSNLRMTATNPSTVKAIMLVISPANTTPFNSMIVSQQTSGAQWYTHLGSNGTVDLINMGASAQYYQDGKNIRPYSGSSSTSGTFNAPLTPYYSGRVWSVIIINNIVLPNGNLSFLAWDNDVNWSPVIGTKLGCIAMYSQTLTLTDIANLTTWGKRSFSAF
jgi:hypothetical protein